MVNKKSFIFIFLIIGFFASFIIISNFLRSDYKSAINKNIEVASKADSSVYLSEVTPFDWDKAFLIEDSYVGGEALDKIVGVKCNLKRSDVDSIKRIVFIKDNKFVYDYLYNWTEITFSPLGITVDKEHCKFSIEKDSEKRLLLKLSD